MTQADLALGLEEGVARKELPKCLLLAQIANFLIIFENMGAGWFSSQLQGEPGPDESLNYLQPSVYAFAIWPVIYAGEVAFAFWQTCCCQKNADVKRLEAIRNVAPSYCLAHAITIVWMFLPSLWTRALALALVAVCLGVAHGIVAPFDQGADFYCMAAPITLHFGWATAATLVSWNIVAAQVTQDVATNFAVLVACLLVAVVAGAFFAVRRRSALLAGTVAWAVVAVGVEHLFPISAERLAKYSQDFGETGRYLLAATELALGGALVAVAVFVRRQR